MNLSQIPTWLLCTIMGVALKIAVQEKTGWELKIKSIVIAIVLGFFVNEICKIKGGEWIVWSGVVEGATGFAGEWVLQFIVKFRVQLIKEAVFRLFGWKIHEEDKK